MALRDHFHPPLSIWRHWHSFHNGWASNIAADLNSRLPDRWFAEPTPFEPMAENVQVNIFNSEAGPTLVGAIELVSPGNKDRTAQREAFVTKCENYLLLGVGLVIVDIVTDRLANLHNELMARLGKEARLETRFYATAYRLAEVNHQPGLDIWTENLAIGAALPTMPLWLRGEACYPVDLEKTYEKTCSDLKIELDGIPEPRQAIG